MYRSRARNIFSCQSETRLREKSTAGSSFSCRSRTRFKPVPSTSSFDSCSVLAKPKLSQLEQWTSVFRSDWLLLRKKTRNELFCCVQSSVDVVLMTYWGQCVDNVVLGVNWYFVEIALVLCSHYIGSVVQMVLHRWYTVLVALTMPHCRC